MKQAKWIPSLFKREPCNEAIAYWDLGTIFQMLGDNKKALKFLRKAMLTFERLIGSSDTAVTLDEIEKACGHLVVLLRKNANYFEAEELETKRLKLREQFLGNSSDKPTTWERCPAFTELFWFEGCCEYFDHFVFGNAFTHEEEVDRILRGRI